MNNKLADLIDALVGIDSHVGEKTADWSYSDDFAIQRMKLGASLTVLTDTQGNVMRYTIHHIGVPFKLSPALGNRLLTELLLRKCWERERLGHLFLEGSTVALYQVERS